MELADAIAEVLDQTISQPDEFAQLLGRAVGQAAGRRPLLSPKAGQAEGIDGIRLGALQIFLRKAMGPQRVDQGDRDALGCQRGEDILPVVAGGLHDHQQVRGSPQPVNQAGVALRVFGDGGRLDQHGSGLINHGDHVSFGGDINPREAHTYPLRRARPGASAPVLVLGLVHARTALPPQDTVRA